MQGLPRIISEESFPEEIVKIENELEKIRNEGFFNSFDGKKLYFEYFLKQNAKASIVIVHGLSEFTKKFYEIAWYFLSAGYNVFLYDQRCHGRSCRLGARDDILHVDKFTDYAADLNEFISQIVLKASSEPIYIYSHSMGGAVTALYLSKWQDDVEKAVMSAPLFLPCVAKVSHAVARMSALFCSVVFGKTKKFWTSSEFNPETPHRKSHDASFSRFNYNMDMRRNNREYQTTPMSNGWVYNSLCLRSQISKSRLPLKIKTPILLISAENDKIVELEPQREFAKRCKSCTLLSLKDANHAMLTGTQQTITEHVTAVLEFFEN